MTTLSCSCGSVMPLVTTLVPHVLVCPACGERFQAVDDARGTTCITVLGRDPAWAPPTFAPSPGIWRTLAMIFMLRKFAERDGVRFGIPRRKREADDSKA